MTHGNLETMGTIEGSPTEVGPLHFQGDTAQWKQLVEQYATIPSRAMVHMHAHATQLRCHG